MKQLPIAPLGPRVIDDRLLHVHEIFRSLQGEGLRAGTPSVFLRLFGCNLTCENCDSKGTWHPTKASETTAVMTHQEVAEELVRQFSFGKNMDLVITGGEPMLQADAIERMLQQLSRLIVVGEWPRVTIETNGTIVHDRNRGYIDDFVKLWSLSPKLGTPAASPEYMKQWNLWTSGYSDTQVKIVCSTLEDIEAVARLRDESGVGVHEMTFFVQPEWGAHAANLKWCVEAAIKHGLRVSVQQHKTWGLR